MHDPRTILIVSDDDLLPLEIEAALGEVLDLRGVGGGEERQEIPLRFDLLRLHGPWDMRLPDDGYDCCILSLRQLAATISEAAMEALLRRCRSLLLLGDDGAQRERRLAAAVPTIGLVRPCTDADLRSAVGRLLVQAHPRRDADGIDLLRRLLVEHQNLITPTLVAGEPDAVRYLPVERHLGRDVDARRLLDQLVDAGALGRCCGARLRLCHECHASQLLYEERCGECRGLDFALEPMLHHFVCGYVGRESTFGSGDERCCPKCGEGLLGLGRDHERLGGQMACPCGATAPEPTVLVRCLGCGLVQRPEETLERVVPAYALTERAEEIAVAGGRAGASGQLRDRRSGLFSRDLLVLELEREHARSERSGRGYTVVALAVHNLDQLRERHGVLSLDQLDGLFGRCAAILRCQDLTARWAADAAVALLPETDAAAAAIVLDRLAACVEAECVDWLEPLPELGMSAVGSDDGYHDGPTLVQEALAQARRPDSADSVATRDETLVVLE